MTLNHAAAGLRHDGDKAVIATDHSVPEEDEARLIRAFACAIRDLTEYTARVS